MTIDTKSLSTDVELTEADVRRAVNQLLYRKLYNKRPDVQRARKAYNQRRQETIKLALQAYRRLEGGVK